MICCFLKPVMKWSVLTEQGDVDLPDAILVWGGSRNCWLVSFPDPTPMLVPGVMAWDLDLKPTANSYYKHPHCMPIM